MALFKNCGVYWHLDDTFLGKPGSRGRNKGRLIGVNEANVETDFSNQIGIYALYADFDLVYVGQVGAGDNNTLIHRIRHHSRSELKDRWNRFSWFGLLRVLQNGELAAPAAANHPNRAQLLDHIEGIILQFAEPKLNSQEGRFRGEVISYRQKRDDRLGPTEREMLAKVYELLI
jgi:hypothetical protein